MITAEKTNLDENILQQEKKQDVIESSDSDMTKAYKQTRKKLFESEGIQPQSKIIATNGPVRNVHYLEMGTGKPLILLHGGGSHSSEWINILKPLAQQHHLYVVDRPGCGLTDFMDYRGVDFQESAVEFVRTFMDAVGLETAIFLANSLGGYFSICFAMQHPERVEKLLLMGAPAGMNYYIPFILRLMGTRGINNMMGKPSLKNVTSLYKQILVADIANVSETYLKHTYYGLQLPGKARSFHYLLENVLTLKGWKNKYYLSNQLHQLRIPVRFIWGNKDAFEKPETGKQKAALIPDHNFEIVNLTWA